MTTHSYEDLLGDKECFDESKSLFDEYDKHKNDEILDEIEIFIEFAEDEISYLLQLHHLYSSTSEFFPIIELGEIKYGVEECTIS